MRFFSCTGLALCLVTLGTAAAAQPAADLPIDRVVLFSSGVGYIQHSGTLRGDGALTLHFTGEQLDDVLKSLVVEDRGGGRVEVVSFPSRAVQASNPRIRLDGGRGGFSALLSQLIGAELEIERPNGRYRGRLVGSERLASGEAEQLYISVLTERGIEPIPFAGVTSIRAVDPELQAAIARALEEVNDAHTAPGGDPLQVRFAGSGVRQVSLGYVTRQPLWKTSYRLVMPAGDGRADLQGWAILENHTDRDWAGTSVSLVSGRPISFITRLSRPVFVDRPVLDVRAESTSPAPVRYGAGVPAGVVRGRVLDRDSGEPIPGASVGIGRLGLGAVTGSDGSFEVRNVPPGEHQVRASMVGYTPQTANVDLGRGGATVDFRLDPGVELEGMVVTALGLEREAALRGRAAGAATIDITQSVAAVAEVGEIGEVFEYTIPDVHVARGEAAMLPIVTGRVHVERVSLHQSQRRERHPLRGFRLRNATGQHLQAGPVTVFDDGAYAGDVFLPDLPPAAEQFLSYAADLDLVVTEDLAAETRRRLVSARIENGVLISSYRTITTSTYTVENRGSRQRVLVIEHPRKAQTLVQPQAEELIDGGYRFRMPVRAGRTETLAVSEESAREERMAILDDRADELRVVISGERLPPEVRQAFQRAADLQRAYAAARAERAEGQRRLDDLRGEQARARENVLALPADDPFVLRQVRRVEELEELIGQERQRIEELRAVEQQRRAALERYVRGLNVG